MPVIAAFIVPHPPLIVPEIGSGEEKKIQSTVDAYNSVSERIAEIAPDTIVFITPHSVSYSDYIHISPGHSAEGDFSRFGAGEVSFEVKYEWKLVNELTKFCKENGISAGNEGGAGEHAKLDHGTMVPLHFINKNYKNYRCLRVSISGLPFSEHFKLGQAFAALNEEYNRRTVIIASGDLSHKLKHDGPYGFSEAGPSFDKKITEIIESGDLSRLFEFTETECYRAAECGLRAFIIMAGILDKMSFKSRLLSYEGPFGVGYAVGEFIVDESKSEKEGAKAMEQSEHVKLARQTLESYIKENKVIQPPDNLSADLLNEQAGVFVCIKKNGQLRGCIGTIAPTRQNVAKEIIANSISAGTRDYRFKQVSEEELPSLSYSVDVLFEPEKIDDPSLLDVKEYGVIVTRGGRRGLLLPNLEGIDSVDEQISIALQKGGISPVESYELERFKVVRYE